MSLFLCFVQPYAETFFRNVTQYFKKTTLWTEFPILLFSSIGSRHFFATTVAKFIALDSAGLMLKMPRDEINFAEEDSRKIQCLRMFLRFR